MSPTESDISISRAIRPPEVAARRIVRTKPMSSEELTAAMKAIEGRGFSESEQERIRKSLLRRSLSIADPQTMMPEIAQVASSARVASAVLQANPGASVGSPAWWHASQLLHKAEYFAFGVAITDDFSGAMNDRLQIDVANVLRDRPESDISSVDSLPIGRELHRHLETPNPGAETDPAQESMRKWREEAGRIFATLATAEAALDHGKVQETLDALAKSREQALSLAETIARECEKTSPACPGE